MKSLAPFFVLKFLGKIWGKSKHNHCQTVQISIGCADLSMAPKHLGIILKFHRTLLCPLIQNTKIERIPPF